MSVSLMLHDSYVSTLYYRYLQSEELTSENFPLHDYGNYGFYGDYYEEEEEEEEKEEEEDEKKTLTSVLTCDREGEWISQESRTVYFGTCESKLSRLHRLTYKYPI